MNKPLFALHAGGLEDGPRHQTAWEPRRRRTEQLRERLDGAGTTRTVTSAETTRVTGAKEKLRRPAAKDGPENSGPLPQPQAAHFRWSHPRSTPKATAPPDNSVSFRSLQTLTGDRSRRFPLFGIRSPRCAPADVMPARGPVPRSLVSPSGRSHEPSRRMHRQLPSTRNLPQRFRVSARHRPWKVSPWCAGHRFRVLPRVLNIRLLTFREDAYNQNTRPRRAVALGSAGSPRCR